MGNLRSIAFYAHAVRPGLSREAFLPAHSRLLWVPVHVTVATLGILAVATRGLGFAGSAAFAWLTLPLACLAIGASFAGLAFVAHEALHGGIVRGKKLRYFVGWVGFLPFGISPTLWMAWHNRVHHGHTANSSVDPDTYPTLTQYQESSAIRVFTDKFSLGHQHPAGVLSLLIGLTIQSLHMLAAGRSLAMSPRQHRRAIAETALAMTAWALLAWHLGVVGALFALVLPLVIANVVLMSFILTNHSLSAHTAINDPLVNSLSVTTPAWYEWLTLGFGMHVEHHLFPSMSSRHAPKVRLLLKAQWPDLYQAMPLGKALLALSRSGRIYASDTSLVDPRTGRECATLMPKSAEVSSAIPRRAEVAAATAVRSVTLGEAVQG